MNKNTISIIIIFILSLTCMNTIFAEDINIVQNENELSPQNIQKPLDYNDPPPDTPFCNYNYPCMTIDPNIPNLPVFPSSMPVSMKLGVRQGNSTITWLNCEQALQTTTPIFSDTEMYVHVDSKTYEGCMQQRFDNAASSCWNQEFYDWIITRLIQIPDAGWDEQTIWKYYVNWMAEKQLPVIKNSASVEMVYEVWNLDKTTDGLPPPNRMPQECNGLGEDNALLRRVITRNNNIILFRSESTSYSSVKQELTSILGQYYEGIKNINDWKMNTGKWGIRVSYLYSLKMYDNNGKPVTKCFCGRWTECFSGSQAQIYSTRTALGKIKARIKIGRPSGTDSTQQFHSGSVHYIPKNINCSEVYYWRDNLESSDYDCGSTPQIYKENLYSEQNKDIASVASIQDPGAIFIRASIYADYFLTPGQKCGYQHSPTDNSITHLSRSNESCVTKANDKGLLECKIVRNGIEATFTENDKYVKVRYPFYEVKKKSGYGWIQDTWPLKENVAKFPRYDIGYNTKDSWAERDKARNRRPIDFGAYGFEVWYDSGFVCKPTEDAKTNPDLYIPIHALSYTLGSNMFYYTWDTCGFSDNAGTKYATNDELVNKNVGAIVWDQRARCSDGEPYPLGMHGYYISLINDTKHGSWKFKGEVPIDFKRFFISQDWTLYDIACPHFKRNGLQHRDSRMNYLADGDYRREAFFVVEPYGGMPRYMQLLYDICDNYLIKGAKYSVWLGDEAYDFKCKDRTTGDRLCPDPYPYVEDSANEGTSAVNMTTYVLRCPEYNATFGDNPSMHYTGRGGDFGWIKMKKAGLSIMFDCNYTDLQRKPNLNIWEDGRPNGLKWGIAYEDSVAKIHKIINFNDSNLFWDGDGSIVNRHYYFKIGAPNQALPPIEERPINYDYPIGLTRMEYKEVGKQVTWNHSELSPPSGKLFGEDSSVPLVNNFCP